MQIWVPDQYIPGFRDELRCKIQQLNCLDEAEALDFIAEIANWPEA